MQNKFKQRQQRFISWLKREGIDAAVIEDTEGRRNSAVRYLSGLPVDALLFVFVAGHTLLLPWDKNLAEKMACADEMIPYSDFDRLITTALPQIVSRYVKDSQPILEISGLTPYPLYRELKKSLPKTKLMCRNDGLDAEIQRMRMIKDEAELDILRKAAAITNEILSKIENIAAGRGTLKELDLAMFIEREARIAGAEGTGFESLVAGPSRSFAIHAQPAYTNLPFNTPGLSLLDFGIKYKGYTTDVTMTVIYGRPSKVQARMLSLVEEAYNLIQSLLKPGLSCLEISKAVDDFFKTHTASMPHSLGHSIGLDAHEYPILRNLPEYNTLLKPGMVLAIEPGLYQPGEGGVRLENDFLITEEGTEVLTKARILRFQANVSE
ncbi:MAG: Xaa-Pro peptidase family protein [Spirochaetota bacterium]